MKPLINNATVTVDFNQTIGKIKPLHGLNDGPIPSWAEHLGDLFAKACKDVNAPLIRMRDNSFCLASDGDHVVDTNRIFPDPEADVDDPKNYLFRPTDDFVRSVIERGAKPFFLLCDRANKWAKPYSHVFAIDRLRWAQICERIIAHYTEGWADGFAYPIEYWEIWEEPDINGDFSPFERPCTWSGDRDDYFELYKTVATRLKKRFPHLKFGGAGAVSVFLHDGCGRPLYFKPWIKDFFKFCARGNVPLDFFSWHHYAGDVKSFISAAEETRRALDESGLTRTESILSEWNYFTCDENDMDAIQDHRGAAFFAAVLCACQNAPVDKAMFFTAQPCYLNPFFDLSDKKLFKGRNAFVAFSKISRLETQTYVSTDSPDVFAIAAKGDKKGLLLSFSPVLTETDPKTVTVRADMEISKVYLCDSGRDFAPTDRFERTEGGFQMTLKPHSFVFIEGK